MTVTTFLATAIALSLHCADRGGWTFVEKTVQVAEGVQEYELRMTSDKPARPPMFDLTFALPQVDIVQKWQASGSRAPMPPDWSSACKGVSTLSSGIPVYAFVNGADENRLTLAVSEAKRKVAVNMGNREEGCLATVGIYCFTEPETPISDYSMKVRIDTRNVFWSRAIADGAAWCTSVQSAPPAAVPLAAREPVYSSWYGFHQQVSDAKLERECAIAAGMGMRTLIVDDGWQTDDSSRGYAFCGDWEVSTKRFPDMRAHVEKIHALGMKYVVWVGVAMVGYNSKAYRKFQGKFLREDKYLRTAVFDPRFPEVREHIASLLELRAREWNIDGYKLDFIDSFHFNGTDPAIAQNYAGRDVKSLPEAVDLLMTDITRRLRAIKPDCLVEFRQSYIGPVIRKYGNMIRAGDCPGDCLQNRRSVVDLRLTSGNTAVHSDMLEWHPSDTPENAARSILAVLFSTIQYSMVLGDLPPSHRKVIAHYLDFTRRHADTLLTGEFRPHAPQANYPWIEAEGKDELIVAVYEKDALARIRTTSKTVYVMNVTSSDEVAVDLAGAPRFAEAYDAMGHRADRAVPSAGLVRLNCPKSGFVKLVY